MAVLQFHNNAIQFVSATRNRTESGCKKMGSPNFMKQGVDIPPKFYGANQIVSVTLQLSNTTAIKRRLLGKMSC